MAKLDEYLTEMLNRGGSDLHLSINHPAKIRVHGRLEPLTDYNIDTDYMEKLLHEICPEPRWQHFLKTHDPDFAHEIPGLARFRSNYLCNYHGIAAVFRQIPSKILTLQDLNLPPVLVDICNFKSGLVLVTGPTGSGIYKRYGPSKYSAIKKGRCKLVSGLIFNHLNSRLFSND